MQILLIIFLAPLALYLGVKLVQYISNNEIKNTTKSVSEKTAKSARWTWNYFLGYLRYVAIMSVALVLMFIFAVVSTDIMKYFGWI